MGGSCITWNLPPLIPPPGGRVNRAKCNLHLSGVSTTLALSAPPPPPFIEAVLDRTNMKGPLPLLIDQVSDIESIIQPLWMEEGETWMGIVGTLDDPQTNMKVRWLAFSNGDQLWLFFYCDKSSLTMWVWLGHCSFPILTQNICSNFYRIAHSTKVLHRSFTSASPYKGTPSNITTILTHNWGNLGEKPTYLPVYICSIPNNCPKHRTNCRQLMHQVGV